MSIAALRERLARDGDLIEAYVWPDGFDQWRRAPEVAELIIPVKVPPPLPIQGSTALPAPSPELPESTKSKVTGWVGSAVGIIIGIGLSRALGANFWIPALAVSVTWWLLSKFKVNAPLIPVLAIFIGHTLWIVIGLLILVSLGSVTQTQLFDGLLEIAIVAPIAFWVLKKQSALSLSALMLFELIGFVVLIVNWPSTTSANMVTARAVHFALRIAELLAAIYAIYSLRKLPTEKVRTN
jgi:hypothetical protein